MSKLIPPRVEGTVVLPDGRHLGFAEFGVPSERAILWFHGTPGARRQVPPAARALAEEKAVRLIGVERPGAGSSTPHLYRNVRGFAPDVEVLMDRLGVKRCALIGLSGGGPYVLACAHDMPSRVVATAVLGGVAPSQGKEATPGGLVDLAVRLEPLLRFGHPALTGLITSLVLGLYPISSPIFDRVVDTFPEGDRRVFRSPMMKEMFIDDIVRGATRGLRAPSYDALLFTRDWGFSLRAIRTPVRIWHGDADFLVPLDHAYRMAKLIPDAEVYVRPDESHLGGFGAAVEVMTTLLDLWPRRRSRGRRKER
jgi:pimeloyl-ACP methyl ester carboxylesterase